MLIINRAGVRALAAIACVAIGLGFQSPSVSGVPADVYDRTSNETLRHGYQMGKISYSTANKTVNFLWSAGAEVNLEPTTLGAPGYENNYISRETRVLGTRYYPSSVSVVDYQTILVAGVKDNGKTVLEKWALSWPSAMPAPDTLMGGGPIGTVPVIIPNRSGVSVLLNEDTAGKRVIRNITPVLRSAGPPLAALVQFDDSLDVYQVDLATGSMAIVASAITPGGVGPIPTLALHKYNGFGGGERIGYGYVYVLFRNVVPGSTSWRDTVVLQDYDKDGVIDAHIVVPSDDYCGEGKWSDEDEYVDPWK